MDRLQKRVGWLDTVRALAIVLVVCNHSIERAYTMNVEAMQGYAWYSRVIALAFFTLGRLAVPLFFFLTGYLLLDRTYDTQRTRRFFQKNFLGLLVTTELWIVLYNLFNSWFYQTPLSIRTLLENMFFFSKADMSHMWYMPVILGIYLFLPFVANALQAAEVRNLYIPASIVFFYLFVRIEWNVILTALGRETLGNVLDLSFSGASYGFYVILGYFVKKGVFDRIPSLGWGAVGLCSFAATLAVEYFSYEKGVKYNVWYDNATLLIAALALFVLSSRVRLSHPALGELARCSFGIYLIHNPVMLLLRRYIQLPSRMIQFLMLLVVTLGVSWLLTWIVGKNKWAAKWFLGIK